MANQYEIDLRVPSFKGLYQDGDGENFDPQYALEAVNMETPGGMLQTAARPIRLLPELPGPIGTLANLHRRWHVDADERDVFIAASGGQLYWMLPDGREWTLIEPPEGTEAFESDEWSYVAYEINPEGSAAPVDVLMLSNAKDGMISVRGDSMTAETVPTPKKFGVISRYAERIWGGAIPDDPDMLVYSTPFAPFDWTQISDRPEDGAGDIMQPSWDGDGFTALVPLGPQLIALKRRRVWRILGESPKEYRFREQYGGGAPFAQTAVPVGEGMLMLGRDGLLQYDGTQVSAYYPLFARRVFRRMNQEALAGACACLYKDCYYCALPLDGSEINNAVLVLNLAEKTWQLREGVTVQSFLAMERAMYFTSATAPGYVFQWGEDAFKTGALPCRWTSPWMDMGAKDCRYGGWTVYVRARANAPAEISVTIRTEKKARTKLYKVDPLVTKPKRLAFGGSGRRWQFEIAAVDGVPWSLPGGLQIKVERDPD